MSGSARAPKPFVLVGMPRSGSTLLAAGLAEHPAVRVFGELFHPDHEQRATVHALPADGEESVFFDPERDDAIAFLRRNVFQEREGPLAAVGFKLFGDHVMGPGSDRLFFRLRDEIPDLRVLHIFRPNYLEMLVSLETALLTEEWVVFGPDATPAAPPVRVRLDPELAQAFFARIETVDRFLADHFAGPAYHRVVYDDLDVSFGPTMARVFAFLGLPPRDVAPTTVKQRNATLRERIENFDEFAAALWNTRWGRFFQW